MSSRAVEFILIYLESTCGSMTSDIPTNSGPWPRLICPFQGSSWLLGWASPVGLY